MAGRMSSLGVDCRAVFFRSAEPTTHRSLCSGLYFVQIFRTLVN